MSSKKAIVTESNATLPPEWAAVVAFIKREPENLDKLKRIAGSLKKLAGVVQFGLSLTFEDIGKVIGVEGAKLPR